MVRPTLLFTVSAVIAVASTASRAGQDKDPVYDGKKGSEWVEVLINDKSARKRALAVESLSKLWADKRYEESLPSISRSMRLDSSSAVRAQAVIVLGALKEDDFKYIGKDMIDALGMEKDSRVRREIAMVMGRYPPLAKAGVANLIAALKDAEAPTRIAVAEALGQAGSDAKSAAANLAPMLGEDDKAVRLAAVIALGRISPEGAPAIAETMSKMLASEKDLDIKIELVSSLGLLSEKSVVVVTALAKLLTDKEDELRRRAARTLGTFGVSAAPAADALLTAAGAEKLKDIRVDIVRSFGSALGPNLKGRVKDILPLLKDAEYEVRLAVVEEIGALGNDLREDAETIKVLRSRLSDPHVKVREAVAIAIRKIEKKPEPKDPKKDSDPKKDASCRIWCLLQFNS